LRGRSSSRCTARSSATSARPAVGALLGLGPIAPEGPGTLAELGFDYAADVRVELPGLRPADRRPRPAKGPVSDQHGHKDGCVRLAAEAADWEQEAPR
jgi:hypothetical protein